MSAPSAPPTYNETMQQNHAFTPGQYQPNYGATQQQPMPGYPPVTYPQQPPPGTYDQSKGPMFPPYQPGYPQQHSGIVFQQTAQSVVVVGGCPACRVGVLEDDFTCLGVLCAILFFPLGLICCLAMRQRRCANCGAVFG